MGGSCLGDLPSRLFSSMRSSSPSTVTPRFRKSANTELAHLKNKRAPALLAKNLHRTDWRIPTICLLLTLATFSVYGSLVTHPFLNYDDPQYVSENPHIQAGLSARTVVWALTAYYASNWHPLTWLCHALDYQLYGLQPGGHHVSSLVIHVANVLLLFWLLLRLTAATGRSEFVAALFALHPLNVESVAWIA